MSRVFPIHEYEVTECCLCHLRFLRPQPDDQQLTAIYNANYFLGESDGIAASEVKRLKLATASLYLDQIIALRTGSPGELLEIGSGSGDFLMEAQQRGFSVRGLEFSADAVRTANRRLGEERVQQGEIESVSLPENFFDVAFFSDVIEHVRNPVTFMETVQRCLKPGGLVYIVTPSTDSWSHKLLRRHWMEYKLEHLYYFNQSSLHQLLRRAEFDQIHFGPNYKVLSFEYIHAHFQRFRVPVWSSLINWLRVCIPTPLARKGWNLVASGMVATARKSGGDEVRPARAAPVKDDVRSLPSQAL